MPSGRTLPIATTGSNRREAQKHLIPEGSLNALREGLDSPLPGSRDQGTGEPNRFRMKPRRYAFITQHWKLGVLPEPDTKLLRRSSAAVAAKREALDIAIFLPQRIRSSRREIELLGKRPDAVVARMLGRTRYAVQLKRHSLGIPQCWEDRRPWTPAQDALLGTMRDGELAKRLKRSISSVRSRRNEVTSSRFIRTPKRWTPSDLRLLGRLPDGEIALRTGRFLASVWNGRVQLGIAGCQRLP